MRTCEQLSVREDLTEEHHHFSTEDTMRTLSFTVLLVITVSCTAMPRALNQLSPALCCFKFFTGRMPRKHIVSVTETHSSCRERGLVVSTARGNEICVSPHLDWAQEAFKEQQVIKD